MSQGNESFSGSSSDDIWSRGGALYNLIRQGRSFSGHERNCCFLNLANGRFADISAVSGFGFADDGRAIARVDWDHDGDLDLWIVNRNGPQVRLLRNDIDSGNHWLALRLVGNGTSSNRDAIGARVEVKVAGESHRSIATLRAGDGFLSQSTKWLHFGLGAADQVESVTVRWPDGTVDELAELEADRRYRVTQGGKVEPWQVARDPSVLRPATLEPPPATQVAQILSAAFLPLPPIEYETFSGARRQLVDNEKQSRATLVNLWASWCGPCLAELQQFTTAQDELRAAGIDIVAVSVDGLEGEESSTAEEAQAVIDQLGFPFRAGRALASTIDKLQLVHDHLFDLYRPLAVPTSFLIDAEGRVAALYRGPVDVEWLLGDVARLPLDLDLVMHDAVPFAGKWQNHLTYLEPYRLAWQLFDRGYLEDAIRFLERSAELTGSQWLPPQLQFMLGDAQWKLGDFEAAEVSYRAGIELEPNVAGAYNRLGNLLQSQGRNSDAVREYVRALEVDSENLATHMNLGEAYVDQQQFEEALRHFRRALQLAPQDLSVLSNLGATLATIGKLSEATAHLEQVLELEPEHLQSLTNLAKILVSQGNDKEATSHLQRIVQLDADNPQAHFDLGTALVRQQDLTTALHHFRRAVALAPDNTNFLSTLSVTLAMSGNLSEAAAQLQRVVELNPENAAAHHNLAALLTKQGKSVEAIEHLKRAVSLRPDSALAHYNLGVALAQQKETETAIRHYERAVEIQPDYLKALHKLATTLISLRKVEQATVHFERIVELAPQDPAALANLGVAYLAQDKLELAIQHLKRAVELRPNHLPAMQGLAAALTKAGRGDEAKPYLEQLERAQRANGGSAPGGDAP